MAVAVAQISMLVPLVTVRYLDKSNSTLREPARKQTLPAEIVRRILIDPVEVTGRLAFVCDIHQVRGDRLHSESQLERLYAALQLRIGSEVAELFLVHLLQHVELQPL